MFFISSSFLIFQFLVVAVTAVAGWEFRSVNLWGIVYPYLSVLISNLSEVSIFLFSALLFESYCPEFFELSLATIITVLKPVSSVYVTLLNYDGKKTRDVGFTWRCHLTNVIPESIFHERMIQGITCFVFVFVVWFCFVCCNCCLAFFLGMVLLFSLEWKRWYQFHYYNSYWHGKILSYNGLRQIILISFQWDLKSETCLMISKLDFHWGFFCLGVLCCFLTRDIEVLFNTFYLKLAKRFNFFYCYYFSFSYHC